MEYWNRGHLYYMKMIDLANFMKLKEYLKIVPTFPNSVPTFDYITWTKSQFLITDI